MRVKASSDTDSLPPNYLAFQPPPSNAKSSDSAEQRPSRIVSPSAYAPTPKRKNSTSSSRSSPSNDSLSRSPKITKHTGLEDFASNKQQPGGQAQQQAGDVGNAEEAEIIEDSGSQSNFTGNPIEEESIDDYKEGGYHPCTIGETFKNGRYLIVRKLGWGYFSTVWLAKDRHIQDQYVALKVVRAAQNYTETAIDEVKLLKRLSQADPSHPGRQYVVSLHDQFMHVGPNGAHVCMVFEVLGENLLSLMKRYHYKGVPPVLVKQISIQVLLALDYAHRKCGIIHTDLKPENVLIRIRDISRVLQETEELEANQARETALKEAYQTNSGPPSVANTNDSRCGSIDDESLINAGNSNTVSTSDSVSAPSVMTGASSVSAGSFSNIPEKKRTRSIVTGSQPLPSPLRRPDSKAPSITSSEKSLQANKIASSINETVKSDRSVISDTSTGSIQFRPYGFKSTDDAKCSSTLDNDYGDEIAPDVSSVLVKSLAKPLLSENNFSEDSGSTPRAATPTDKIGEVKNDNQSSTDSKSSISAPLTQSTEESSTGDFDGYTALEDEKVSVKIADFGSACFIEHHFTNDIQTRQYRAPEILLGTKWGAAVDCWSLACMIFELLTGDYLFEPQSSSIYSKDEDHIAQIIELLGQLPPYLQKGRYAKLFFDSRGRLRNIHNLKVWPLYDVFVGKYGFDPEESRKLCDLLLPLLTLDPAKRVDCGSLVNCEWLKDTVGFENVKVDRKPGVSANNNVSGWSYEADRTEEESEAALTASQKELNDMWNHGDTPDVEVPDPKQVAREARSGQSSNNGSILTSAEESVKTEQ